MRAACFWRKAVAVDDTQGQDLSPQLLLRGGLSISRQGLWS